MLNRGYAITGHTSKVDVRSVIENIYYVDPSTQTKIKCYGEPTWTARGAGGFTLNTSVETKDLSQKIGKPLNFPA